jgi:hypothetical protein
MTSRLAPVRTRVLKRAINIIIIHSSEFFERWTRVPRVESTQATAAHTRHCSLSLPSSHRILAHASLYPYLLRVPRVRKWAFLHRKHIYLNHCICVSGRTPAARPKCVPRARQRQHPPHCRLCSISSLFMKDLVNSHRRRGDRSIRIGRPSLAALAGRPPRSILPLPLSALLCSADAASGGGMAHSK